MTKTLVATLILCFSAAVPSLYAKCSNGSLKGTYGYSSQGFSEVTQDISASGFVPFSQTGEIVYDGEERYFQERLPTRLQPLLEGSSTGPLPELIV